MAQTEGFLGGRNNFKTSLTLSAVALTLIFFFLAYQIRNLQNNGENLVANLNDTKEINTLIGNLESIENILEKKSLEQKFIEQNKASNNNILKNLNGDKKELLSIQIKSDTFYSRLNNFSQSKVTDNQQQLNNLLKEIGALKKDIQTYNKNGIAKNTKAYNSHNNRFPIYFVLCSIIGFSIVALSLSKIFETQSIINEKSSILDSILDNTDDIANFYEPYYDANNKLVDFKITYASKANTTLTKLPYNKILGSLVSETFPFLKASGVFHQLISAFKNQQYFEKNLEIPIDNKTRYLRARYIPVETGLQVMITELTSLYAKQKELITSNNELSLKNTLFHEAEEVAKLGSFVWHLDEEHTVMSDNVYRILGYEPQSINMSANKFKEFVHPEDLERYNHIQNSSHMENKPIEFVFRVFTKDTKTKYLFIKGDYSERNGEPIMVGVLQDVTKSIKTEKKLKEQNITLKTRNAELDSFNRVASHDLQEPLRKIQMFVSRISDEEEENLTEKSQEYFGKIEQASTRMRRLINNLLAFSRIDNKDYEYELVDLNETITNVLDTLSESAVAQNFDINVGNLPNVHAIPFLMEQLFTNIIGNAIKYKSEERDNKIKIESSKVHYKQISEKFIKTHSFYHQIKITDNGIGFNQSDSKKIFELFSRLHSKNKYSGTGLGLAICNKIVNKHFGHIHANSFLGEGSIFTIYLPSGELVK